MLTLCFLSIHVGMSQYVGAPGFGPFEYATIVSIAFSGLLTLAGLDGIALIMGFSTTSLLLVDTSSLYWRHRRGVPFLMDALTLMALICAVLFGLRAYALASNGQWVVGGPPENWIEDLTALLATPLVTMFGPIVVALHHVRARIQLITDALTDALTGLNNRRALFSSFGSRVFDEEWSIVMFDLDNFKRTNDVFGHQIGDEVLIRFARVIERYSSSGAQGYRLGGEEFALVIAKGGGARALQIARQIAVTFGTEVVRTPLGALRSTVSGGMARGGVDGCSLEDLLAAADAALYRAKREGRNRIVQAGAQSMMDDRLGRYGRQAV